MIDLESNSGKLLIFFEKAAYNEELQDAFNSLCDGLLLKIDKGEFFSESQAVLTDYESICTRLVAAYHRFILSKSLNISDDAFNALARFVFFSSVYRHKTAYENFNINLTEVRGNKKCSKLDSKLIKKQLLLSSPSKKNLQLIKFLDKGMQLAYLIGLLSSKYILTQEDEGLRDEVIQTICDDSPFPLDHRILDRLSSAWMHCSYALSDDKHKVKIPLNNTLRSWMREKGFEDSGKERVQHSHKPTIVIFAERIQKIHAMYRCYALSLSTLQEFFRVILVADIHDIDPVSYEWVDETIVLDANKPNDFDQSIKKIQARKPDVILYPSLGMHYWTIALSTIRLAPIQVVMPGHPATTHSPVIDYMMTEGCYVADENRFSECIIKLNDGAMPFIMRNDARLIEPVINENPDVINIAVSASTLKLNYRFLSLCKQINERSKKEIIFHFFPARNDIELLYINDKISSIIGGDVVTYASADYNAYISNLNRSDFMLSPFPFGGTNSNIDAVRQGLPVVCMDGPEMHTHIDSVMMHRLGQPEWLSVKTEEEYVSAALRLIENNSERVEISRHHVSVDALSSLNRCERIETGIAMDFIYKHHEEIMAMRKNSVHINELENIFG